MTTRRLEVLPPEWQGPILELVMRAREAAAPPEDLDRGPWAIAETGQVSLSTGYKASRHTASAGQYAAHILRMRAAVAAPGDASRNALAAAGPAINSWDWDERMQAALDLRRTFKSEAPGSNPDSMPARMVAPWLTHSGGRELLPSTARLCRYALGSDPDENELAGAWYATHGRRLVAHLAAGPSEIPDGSSRAGDVERAQLRAAVRGLCEARVATRTELAAFAGVARPTLDAWLSGPDSAPPSNQDAPVGAEWNSQHHHLHDTALYDTAQEDKR